MPATQVTPQLRRLLSDEARRTLTTLWDMDATYHHVHHLNLTQRLSNCRVHVELDVPGLDFSAQLSLVVSEQDYCYRYHISNIDLCILTKNNMSTKWILHPNGTSETVMAYIATLSQDPDQLHMITTFLNLVDAMDLLEVFQASQKAIQVPSIDTSCERYVSVPTTTNEHTFFFDMDCATGQPFRITQEGKEEEQELILTIHDYARWQERLEAPVGIPNDIELMVGGAMDIFNDWLPEAQKCVMDIFDEIDKDGDGFVSGTDVCQRLDNVGLSRESAEKTSKEMVRLLGDHNNPSEEFDFHQFCGFWMAMLSEGHNVEDNDLQMVRAFRQLFCGETCA